MVLCCRLDDDVLSSWQSFHIQLWYVESGANGWKVICPGTCGNLTGIVLLMFSDVVSRWHRYFPGVIVEKASWNRCHLAVAEMRCGNKYRLPFPVNLNFSRAMLGCI